jgi:hypothetical protein
MKRSITAIAIACAALLWASAPANAAFGLKDLDVTFTDAHGEALTQAGRHPFAMTTSIAVNTKPETGVPGIEEVPDGEVRNLVVTQVTGLAGNPTAVQRCSTLDFINEAKCSLSTVLGRVTLTIGNTVETVNVYNLDPPPGHVAKFGFLAISVPVTVEAELEPTPPYNIVARVTNITNAITFFASKLTLWGVPADPAHDAERGGKAEVPEVPFLTVPRACEGPLTTSFEALSWQGSLFSQSIFTHDDSEPPQPLGFTGCEKVGFAPQRADVQPTTDQAGSPSGLDFNLDIEDESLADPEGIVDSDVKKTTVTLPEGVTLNPSIAEGLATCSKAGYEAESLTSETGAGCPEASKVGTVEAETPLLEGTVLKGQLFVAQQDDPATAEPGAENPFDSLIALYMVVKEPQKGILVKLAGKVSPNPVTGQIETTFGEPGQELPQEPLSHVRVHLREGGRSPLITPSSCGTYTTEAIFTPWANPDHPVTVPSSFEINRGVGGGACPPAGPPPFLPGLEAGTLNNDAKSFSPYYIRLTRRDGDQDLTKISTLLPKGVIGSIAGVSQCSDASIAAAKGRSGRAELASPSCPANSQIGHTQAGAGVGSQLTYVPGSLYLSGPYHGDPLSVVAITSAVAGPFDVGTVVVRFALAFNPRTLEVEVDGAASDPIPHILQGIVLKVRDVRAYVDRPHFTFNPTDCQPSATRATLFGSFIDVFNPADDVPVSLAARFQAANCARLPFKPQFSFLLRGGVRRGANPALRTVVTPRSQDANFSRAVVTLPRSAFLDQGHIRTICTRVQFAAKACPEGAIYGHARAWTPLLDEPAEGPVYLRSSNHNLPDLVVALKGPPSAAVEAELVGRIDSHKGGIRASFESIPDVPVSRFILNMQGGKKGLIVNSRNLCANPSRATARLTGQNGRQSNFLPLVRAAGCQAKH